MKAARFSVSVELLGEALHMPPHSLVIGASMSRDGRSVVFVAEDWNLPDSVLPHESLPTITKESFRWDWNVPA